MPGKNLMTKPLPFEEAIKFFKSKVPMTTEEYRQLEATARRRAFTVAKVTRMDILQDILDELRNALETGESLGGFQKTIKEKMEVKGWKGLTPYRLDNIFRTNIQTAYMAGRYKQMNSPDVVGARPYWMYSAVKDGGTRPSHLAMDGVVRRYDDPIWKTWYPPNGFRCRCKVIALSQDALERRGLTEGQGNIGEYINKETGEVLPLHPDGGFGHNPGLDDWTPDLGRYDPDVKSLYNQSP